MSSERPSDAALTLQRFLRDRRRSLPRPTPELWRRVRAMARGDRDPELVRLLLEEPGWRALGVRSEATLPLLVRKLESPDPAACACACALVAGGMLEGAVPARPALLEGVVAGISRWAEEG